jgi:cytochrome c biogenesis protein CcmG/thiol:disulfide interchange protein DsbE
VASRLYERWGRGKLRLSALAVGGLAVLGALVASGCARPSAQEVARKVEQAYAGAAELQQASAIRTSVDLMGKKSSHTELSRLYYKRPRMLRIESGSGEPTGSGSEAMEAKAVCDGKSLYTRAMNARAWLREPAPKKWDDSELLGLYTPACQELLFAMLDGGTPLSSVKDLSIEDKTERLNGAKCYVLSASTEKTHAGGAFSFTQRERLWVGTRDYLIRKCAVTLVPKVTDESSPLGSLVKKLRTSEEEVMTPSLRLKAKPDVFSFKSEPGTQVVAYEPGAMSALQAASDRMAPARKLVGGKAPDLSLSGWAKGPEATLAQLKGKVVLLDFWATWCVPCVQTVPLIERMDRDYSPRGLVVIGISDNSSGPGAIRKFMRDHGMTYRVAIDKEADDGRPLTFVRYRGSAIPMAVLIGRDGIVRWVGHPGDQKTLKSQIEALL